MKETGEDDATSSFTSHKEPGTSFTTIEAKETVGYIVQNPKSNPKESYLKVAKRSLRHLKETQDLVLYYPSGNSFNLIRYVDANYASYLVDRKNTSGMVHLPGSRLISWGTRKQNSVALLIAEAEYTAAVSCCTQLL
ncbi:secreted RxLR effector protein 161-like [Nicotiana sylvestris]|uniref:secreted RxLR effector protein 161-like n=1 Tax=Nicotiana sylvestris TaxID=4096 RepID=UPI00388CE506